MNHKHKIKMAKGMLTRNERRFGTPIFQSKAWKLRKKTIADRVKRKQGKNNGSSKLLQKK